jgi:asparagine synthase (glutamine-hydrolysing)
MSGIAGGTIEGPELQELVGELTGRGREKAWRYEHGGSGLGISYPAGDPGGMTVWDDGSRAGIAYGAVTNLPELGFDRYELFERLLDAPVRTAAAVEGSFLLACYDGSRDTHVVVTDKLGSRQCFYARDSGFQYATSVAALLPFVDAPELDVQGASDLLLMGHMWGDRTLVDQVSAIRPATVLESVDGAVTTTRYWKPSYEVREPGGQYLSELTDRYRQAARRTASTMPEEAGIWLSGGLDSRMTAAALLDGPTGGGLRTLTAYGYDANPPTSDNPEIATAVANEFSIEYVEVPLSASTFAGDFERVIEVTDGMVRWNTTANLSPSYRVTDGPPVLMEGMQGSLLGDHLLRYHFDDSRSLVETQRASETATSVETVSELLTPDVDPEASFEREASRTDESTHHAELMDIVFQNYYARRELASDRVMRDCAGTRAAQVDGDYLELCAGLPKQYRKGTFPFSHHFVHADSGGVPYGTSVAKLEVCKRLCPDLADIKYERTKMKPSRPYPLHVAGFVGNVVINRLRSRPTYGNGQLQDFWIRDTETYVHRRVRDLIDDAVDRELFDADAVRSVYDDHMDGENNATLLAEITTLEYWLQEHLD